ncbi:hypothetical protein ACQ4M3_19155 [Leptolyngbya sp. AN03gr2]
MQIEFVRSFGKRVEARAIIPRSAVDLGLFDYNRDQTSGCLQIAGVYVEFLIKRIYWRSDSIELRFNCKEFEFKQLKSAV